MSTRKRVIYETKTDPSQVIGTSHPAMSSIYLCFLSREDQTLCALKRSPKSCQKPHAIEGLRREASIVANNLLSHPNIVKGFSAFETKDAIYVAMEYLRGGDLFDYLKIRGRLAASEARLAMVALLSALDFVHKSGFVHCDVKIENLLLTCRPNVISSSDIVKLGDFGYVIPAHNPPDAIMGSPAYASPEIIRRTTRNTFASDMWAVGAVLYGLLYSELPFDVSEKDKNANPCSSELSILLAKITSAIEPPRFTPLGEKLSTVRPPKGARDLVRGLLNKNHHVRLCMGDALKNEWIVGSREA